MKSLKSYNIAIVWRTTSLLGMLMAFLILQATARVPAALAAVQLPSSINLEQWQTQGSGAPMWTTGALNSGKHNYGEGLTVPFRLDLAGVPNDTYYFYVCRDFLNGTKFGYLYLEPYNTTVAGMTNAQIGGAITHNLGPFSGVNVTINTWNDNPPTAIQNCGGLPQLATYVEITINRPVSTDPAYLLWGGHLAAPGETYTLSGTTYTVSAANGASSFPGGSLQMRVKPDSTSSGGKTVGIQTNSVLAAPLITVRKFLSPSNTPLNGWCFGITGGATQNKCAESTTNIVVFSALPTGSYTVSEVLQPSYVFVSLSGTNCTQSGSTGLVTLSTSVATATCDFFNRAVSTSVNLNSFKGVARAKNVKLKWRTGSEFSTFGFNVYRSRTKNGTYDKLNDEVIPAKHPGQLFGAKYKFLDATAQAGTRYFYKLELLDQNLATLEVSDIVKVRKPPSQ